MCVPEKWLRHLGVKVSGLRDAEPRPNNHSNLRNPWTKKGGGWGERKLILKTVGYTIRNKSNSFRIGSFFLSLFILLTLAGGCGDRAERTYKRGLKLARQKKFDQAEVEIRRLIRMEPENAKAHNALGQIYRAQNLYTKAIEELTLSVELSSTDPELPYNLGCLYRDLENLPKAAEYYHQAIEIDPGFYPALYRLGAIYADQGEPVKAEKYFQEFLAGDPDRPAPGHNNLGVLLWKAGERNEARLEFEEALENEPALPAALYNFGVASLSLNEKDKTGIKALLAFLKARPHAREGPELKRFLLRIGVVSASDSGLFSRDDYINHGQEFEDAGQYRMAVKEYHRALRLDPNSSEAHRRLGVIYDRYLEDKANAIHHYEIFLSGNRRSSHAPEVISRLKELRLKIGVEALAGKGLIPTPSPLPALTPVHPVLSSTPVYTAGELFRKGEEWRKNGDLSRAITAYRQSLKLSPDNSRAYLGIATAYLTQGRYDEAVAALLKTRSLDRTLPVKKLLTRSYLRLGAGALSSKQFKKSIEYYKKAREEGSVEEAEEGLWKAYHACFRKRYQDGDYKAAAAYLRFCLKIKPNVADDYLELGDLYTDKLGDRKQGRRDYAKYLKLSPRGKEADRVRKILEPSSPVSVPGRDKPVLERPVKYSSVEYYNRGTAYQRSGEYELARREYLRAINLKPNFYQAYYNLGVLYNKKGQPSKALDAYKKAARLNQNFARAQLAIFNLYYHHYKMKNLARPYAERYVKLAPGTKQAGELSKWLRK